MIKDIILALINERVFLIFLEMIKNMGGNITTHLEKLDIKTYFNKQTCWLPIFKVNLTIVSLYNLVN